MAVFPLLRRPPRPAEFPTAIILPLWARGLTLRTAIDRVRISDVRVRLISPEFKMERGLAKSPLDPRLKATLDPAELIPAIREEAPVDGVEIVEWMIYSHADNIVAQARCLEYNRLGSQMISDSNDAYIPGVSVEDVSFRKDYGSTVRTRGFAIATTPRGSFNVPNLGKSPGIFRDYLTWGSISWSSAMQWCGNLLKWKSLADTPIRQTVGFYRDSRGNVAPQFFNQVPPRPKLTITIRQRFESSDPQTLTINFRDPTDYTRVVGTRSVDIASGESEVTYTISSFPYVPPLCAEIQPEDGKNTKLNEYVVA